MLNFEMDFCMHQDIDEIRPQQKRKERERELIFWPKIILERQTFENFYKKQKKKTKKLEELVELM